MLFVILSINSIKQIDEKEELKKVIGVIVLNCYFNYSSRFFPKGKQRFPIRKKRRLRICGFKYTVLIIDWAGLMIFFLKNFVFDKQTTTFWVFFFNSLIHFEKIIREKIIHKINFIFSMINICCIYIRRLIIEMSNKKEFYLFKYIVNNHEI